MKKVAPAPPYSSGTSMPMMPELEAGVDERRAGSAPPCPSARTSGPDLAPRRTARTASRNIALVLGEVGQGQAAAGGQGLGHRITSLHATPRHGVSRGLREPVALTARGQRPAVSSRPAMQRATRRATRGPREARPVRPAGARSSPSPRHGPTRWSGRSSGFFFGGERRRGGRAAGRGVRGDGLRGAGARAPARPAIPRRASRSPPAAARATSPTRRASSARPTPTCSPCPTASPPPTPRGCGRRGPTARGRRPLRRPAPARRARPTRVVRPRPSRARRCSARPRTA